MVAGRYQQAPFIKWQSTSSESTSVRTQHGQTGNERRGRLLKIYVPKRWRARVAEPFTLYTAECRSSHRAACGFPHKEHDTSTAFPSLISRLHKTVNLTEAGAHTVSYRCAIAGEACRHHDRSRQAAADFSDTAAPNLEPGPSALETVAWWPKRIGPGDI